MTKTLNRTAIIVCKGKGKAQREAAFIAIAPLSFVEDTSRSQSISNLRAALGASPSDNDRTVARREWIIGRVASRLPAGELPRKDMPSIDKLEHARKLICDYASAPKDGVAPRKLRKGQLGRRSPMQERVVRNAQEAWSQVAAELALGNAKTQGERNKAKRAPQMAGSSKGKASPPSHSVLVKPVTPVDALEARAALMHMASTALAYANKHAKLIPTDYAKAVRAFKTAIIAADKATTASLAAADAKRAELEK